jgi:hypothetical protein
VGLQFVPSLLTYDPIYRGIFVNRAIRRVSPLTGLATGKPIQVVEAGAIVEIRIEVTSADDLPSVVVEDLLPGGLEPLDSNLKQQHHQPQPGSSPSTAAPISSSSSSGVRPAVDSGAMLAPVTDMSIVDWWSPFGRPEILTERVRWTSPYFYAGTSSVSYKAIAVTSGRFVLPPARAKSLLQPETMGLSASGTFLVSDTVVPQEEVAVYLESGRAISMEPMMGLKECTDICTAEESCNLRVGQCLSTTGARNGSNPYIRPASQSTGSQQPPSSQIPSDSSSTMVSVNSETPSNAISAAPVWLVLCCLIMIAQLAVTAVAE